MLEEIVFFVAFLGHNIVRKIENLFPVKRSVAINIKQYNSLQIFIYLQSAKKVFEHLRYFVSKNLY